MTTEAEKALDKIKEALIIGLPRQKVAIMIDGYKAALQAQQKPKQTLKDLTDKITDENRHDPVPENRYEAVEVTIKQRLSDADYNDLVASVRKHIELGMDFGGDPIEQIVFLVHRCLVEHGKAIKIVGG